MRKVIGYAALGLFGSAIFGVMVYRVGLIDAAVILAVSLGWTGLLIGGLKLIDED